MKRTRTSRTLIAILILTIVIGVEEYHRRSSRAPAAHQATARALAAATGQSPESSPPIARAGETTGDRTAPLLLLSNDVLTTQTPSSPSASAAAAASPARSAPHSSAPLAAAPSATPATSPSHATETQPPARGPASQHPLVDGKALLDAGDLVGGRRILNDALIAGHLNASDTAAAESMIAAANQSIIFSPRRFASDPFTSSFTVPPGAVMAKIAASNNTTADLLCRINNIPDPRRMRANATLKIVHGPFYAVVTKSAFTMDLYLGAPGGEGSVYVMTFPIGLGKDDSTPTGTWMVEPGRKLKNPTYYSPRGEGVIEAGDPKNPLGKFWIGLTGTDGQAVGKMSYGIHGNIDPNSIGKQSSMGCIRMRNEDVPLVYEMLVEGKSKVVVKD